MVQPVSRDPRTMARPCPRCGQSLLNSVRQRVAWLEEPVRTCTGCGLGVSEHRSPGGPLRERLRIPISIARLVLVPMILLAVGILASVVNIEITQPRLDELGVSFTYEIGVALLSATAGCLAIVLMAPHRGALACGCTWAATTVLCTYLVLLMIAIDLGPRGLNQHHLFLIAVQTAGVALGGCLLSYPLASIRDLVIRLWTRPRSDEGGRS